MDVNGKHYRTIWLNPKDEKIVQIIDQRYLPHKFVTENLKSSDDVAKAIKEMHVRGAGLIGVTAAYGMYLASLEAQEKDFDSYLIQTGEKLKSTRPTAINLSWAVDEQLKCVRRDLFSLEGQRKILFQKANEIADEDAENCEMIGKNGFEIIYDISQKKNSRIVNIMTHCNAGWLAFVDYGSALSPIYQAFHNFISVHVLVSKTSPRNQGTLTAWELEQEGVPYKIVEDNECGYLMQKGLVDLIIVGADRITRTGDFANKIGTLEKAICAKEFNIPFYVAAPSSTFDWKIRDGKEIPIEERSSDEVKYVSGLNKRGKIERVLVTPRDSEVLNYGFDVTPSEFVTGIITERGICEANEKSILKLFPEYE
jgi:methylthioribose-1-phosphate isomerase